MTLIAMQDGKVVMRDGKVGTEQACCCEQGAQPCPSGCPSLENCNLVVVLDYGDVQNEVINEPKGYVDGQNCWFDFYIEDLNTESGGDIDGVVYVAYDEDCNPIPGNVEIGFANENAPSFPNVIITFVCNPLP